MPASFNSSQLNGLSALIPASDGYLSYGRVRTSEPAITWRRKTYVIPGLAGSGSVNAGRVPPEITWDLECVASTWAFLAGFEAKIATYKIGGRYRLVSELSNERYWDYVELVAYEPEPLLPIVGTTGVLRVARVRFRWMQPS